MGRQRVVLIPLEALIMTVDIVCPPGSTMCNDAVNCASASGCDSVRDRGECRRIPGSRAGLRRVDAARPATRLPGATRGGAHLGGDAPGSGAVDARDHSP